MKNWSCALNRGDMKSNPGKIKHQAYENSYVISNIDIGKIRRQAYENAYVISVIDVSKIKHQAYKNSKGLLNTKLPLMNSCTKGCLSLFNYFIDMKPS